MTRPEALFPLFASLETLPGIGPKAVQALATLGVVRPRDLLFLLPQSGIDRRRRPSIRDITPPAVLTVEVEIGAHFPARRKGGPMRVMVRDAGAEFPLVYFHARGDWIRRHLPTGERRLISGKVELFDGVAQMVHPDHVLPLSAADTLPEFEPVYPLAAGLNQRQMARAIAATLALMPDLPEWLDPALMAREGWPGWGTAVQAAHVPNSTVDLAPTTPARQRLAYDELLAHQVTLALARQHARRQPGRASRGTGTLQAKVIAGLPYTLTGAQTRTVAEITADMAAPHRMNRLLQGDVGAGKTLVAFLALLIAVESGGQGVMMAPTEILARQHFAALQPLAALAGVRLEILTGRDKGAERAARLAALAKGEIAILVGTHAVFQKDVTFADLRLAVVDEQHRFGVAQRLELGAKGAGASRGTDMLVMTATPIPRSLALTQYGDLDLSVLDEKPPGRQPVQTVLVSTRRMADVIARLQAAVAAGRQAYWVCPLVAESAAVDLAAAEARFDDLSRHFAPGQVVLVHGQMPAAEKDAAMAAFVAGQARVLVATTVIEVGVDVPAASIMVVEQAETFGLAQLHQLRGRVGRGTAQSTCLLLYRSPLGETARQRLQVLRDTDDGFRIAEADLAIRGAGDLIGMAQSGLPRFRVADLERQAGLLTMAQRDARLLLDRDPGLTTPRGQAIRNLLWLLDQDQAFRLLRVG